MYLNWLDWTIVAATFGLMAYGVVFAKGYMKSVADFLAANRTAGRYLISVSIGMAMLGAVSVIGEFEQFYKSGFCLHWWGLSQALVILVITVSGWVVYRFRQTRALTLAQFFEQRYSRSFRVFAGLLAFISGIINFGIFPAIGARFFIYYTGLPASIPVFGLEISTFVILMLFLLIIALFFVFAGGQIAVIIADFIQGVFSNAVFVIMILYFLVVFDWNQIFEALSQFPQDASMIDPFKTSQVDDFNFWYFLIGMIGLIYNKMAWQGTQAYNASAKSAHEAKMAEALGNWRNYPRNLFLMFIPVIAITAMYHPDFSHIADQVNRVLATVDSSEIQSQIRVPLVLRALLPTGLLGAFAAVMLAAFVSTHDTYLHSWGAIFIQDVVMPFRKKPFTQKEHLRVLRWAIAAVAVFIFFFSLLFKQSQHIYLFFAVTAAIFVGGSGAVIIGGLYWKRGTTGGAYAAMIVGAGISIIGIVLNQTIENFPINGQWFWGISMVSASIAYILVSLLKKHEANLDRLLHRGEYAVEGEMKVVNAVPTKGWKMLGMGREFTKGDKFIYIATYVWIAVWTVIFIIGTVISFSSGVADNAWMSFWKIYVIAFLIASGIVVVWFSIGGIIDMKAMFRRLSAIHRDEEDDGFVHK